MNTLPASLRTIAGRLDPAALDLRGDARVRLTVRRRGSWDVELRGGRARLRDANGTDPHAELSADSATWRRIAAEPGAGVAAYNAGALRVKRNVHLAIGVIGAASGERSPARLRCETITTRLGRISTMQAGDGDPVVLLHGLGASKAEFVPTVAALSAAGYRTIALDLPGFGDSDKPFPAPYDAPFFARWVRAALDELGLDRVHLLGHSMGGRVALEVGLRDPARMASLVLMTPSMAWLAERRWAGWLRLVRPELGIFQPTPRPIVEAIVRRVVPAADSYAVGPLIDEFLRSYMTPRGRVAFYAAARQIYLEEPDGFWSGLCDLAPDALFIWGRRDMLVPLGFERHVRRSLPAARHVVLDCGHGPQYECPGKVHAAIERFLASATPGPKAGGGSLHRVRPQRAAG